MQPGFLKAPPAHTAPFWEGARRGSYLLQQCSQCRHFVSFPREACPRCLSQEHTWVEASGRGVVYAASTHYIPFEAKSAEDCPYVVAMIELEEGPRVVANIVGENHLEARAGDAVRLAWIAHEGDHALPAFEALSDGPEEG